VNGPAAALAEHQARPIGPRSDSPPVRSVHPLLTPRAHSNLAGGMVIGVNRRHPRVKVAASAIDNMLVVCYTDNGSTLAKS
jgi:hypothetical protein